MFLLLGLTLGLTLLSLFCYYRRHDRAAIGALMGAGLSLRLVMATVDPFLHDFDEKYHALVAKNMLADWTTPILRLHPVLPYNYQTWCCNHIWVHKQPLFLWQMTLSMHLFGVSELAVRLPSVLLTTLLIWPVYRIGKLAYNRAAGYFTALLLVFAQYQLELISGGQSVDHSDIAFLFYITASIWAYVESQQPGARVWRWSLLAGLLAGAATLCKWLPGLVVYAGWGLTLLSTPARRRQPAEYLRLGASGLVALAVFLPWQLYIHHRFPVESAYEQQFSAIHFWKAVEGQGGPWYFYFRNLFYQYQWLLPFIVGGLVLALRRPRPALRPLLLICAVVFLFFSAAATKMPSYTYIVSPLLLLLVGIVCAESEQHLLGSGTRAATVGWTLLLLLIVLLNLRPDALLKHHTLRFAKSSRTFREQKLQHTAVYRQLDALVPPGYVVFNTTALEDVEAMFYSSRNVYSWWPTEAEYRSLRARGIRLATFPDHGQQVLPAYMRGPDVLVIKAPLQSW
ncbi:ArnT family glycosyltransferase [Hymenobacter algoricola]|uniref:Glycosyltransferase RgtA/B/C/D-like domain-containing protein n=1 Tax=Hymenobacter algoricola TaxID=486267 RepID=A0ABP7MZR6_9BACT